LEIGAREGNYDGMPQERIYIIVMGGLEREPKSVLLNGSERVECQYDSVTREATFALPAMSSEKSCKVIVKY
jgi:hypothetical protein